MAKQMISDLKEKDHFESYFLASERGLGVDRNGKAYLTVALSDASGRLNARAFERVDELAPLFEAGDFIWAKGYVQIFMGRKQAIIQDVRRAEAGEFQVNEVVRSAAGDLDELFKNLRRSMESLRNEHIRALSLAVLDDPDVKLRLMKAPAAKSIHHAYLGGLLEHVVSIVGIMDFLAGHYPRLHRDLLLFGAFFHDIGKLWELSLDRGIHYSDQGRLVGHMAIACELIDEKARAIAGFPKELKDVLKHIVLSHHGRHEYGSPQLPMLPEALLVAMVDDMDSKMNTLTRFMDQDMEQSDGASKWTNYNPHFERYFYLDFFRRSED